MTDPVAPAKFVHPDDIAARFEGTIPAPQLVTNPPGRVQLLIEDVESTLIGFVPSLAAPADQVDPDRLRRVKALVCAKVLQLYRNPDGANQVSQTMEQDTVSRSYYRDTMRGLVSFTPEELDGVRLRTKRSKFGTVPVAPWRPTC
ncbi:hypothetical protein [Mycolicibacterium brisbanense]